MRNSVSIAQDKSIKLTSIDTTCIISTPNPMFDYLLESSRRDDSNKWSNIGFGEVIGVKEIKIRSSSEVLVISDVYFDGVPDSTCTYHT